MTGSMQRTIHLNSLNYMYCSIIMYIPLKELIKYKFPKKAITLISVLITSFGLSHD